MEAKAEVAKSPWFEKCLIERFPWIGRIEIERPDRVRVFVDPNATIGSLMDLQALLAEIRYGIINILEEPEGVVVEFDPL